MWKLIALEVRRNNLRTYFIASVIITIVMIGFISLFAYAPQLDPNDQDMRLFVGYENIISLFSVLNMAAFTILASVMFSRFVIEEYAGKRTILLFSYPVSRRAIFLAKLIVVVGFTMAALILSNATVFLSFMVIEFIMPLVDDLFTWGLVVQALQTTMVMAVCAASLGIIAVGLGFIKKSVPTTIVSAVVLASFICNIVANTMKAQVAVLVATVVFIAISAAVVQWLVHIIKRMEVQ